MFFQIHKDGSKPPRGFSSLSTSCKRLFSCCNLAQRTERLRGRDRWWRTSMGLWWWFLGGRLAFSDLENLLYGLLVICYLLLFKCTVLLFIAACVWKKRPVSSGSYFYTAFLGGNSPQPSTFCPKKITVGPEVKAIGLGLVWLEGIRNAKDLSRELQLHSQQVISSHHLLDRQKVMLKHQVGLNW